jgi:flagellin-like hook-associated protein FlgL
MRITSNMMASQQLAGLQMNMAALQKAQQQVSTGKRLSSASEDPSATMSIMQSGSSLRALEQYRTSVQSATSRLGIEDAALQQLGDLVSRVKVLGVQASGDTATAQTRTMANTEIQQVFNDIVAIGNTKYNNEYLFGGEQNTVEPFAATGAGATLDYTTTNPQGQRANLRANGHLGRADEDRHRVERRANGSRRHGRDRELADDRRPKSRFAEAQSHVVQVGPRGCRRGSRRDRDDEPPGGVSGGDARDLQGHGPYTH